MLMRRSFWEDQFRPFNAACQAKDQDALNALMCSGDLPMIQLVYDASPVKKDLFLVQETSLARLCLPTDMG